MPALLNKLKTIQDKDQKPVWTGPDGKGWNGGITQSMLQKFLICRERFRINSVLGLRPLDKFSKNMEYGNMWHCMEEDFAKESANPHELLTKHTAELTKQYPLQQEEIIHWYEICKMQFELYKSWWSEHGDVMDRMPLLEEYSFDSEYQLPSGRMVRLRGKYDSVDLVGGEIWLQENKTKGDIDEQKVERHLTFDLQTGMYMAALSLTQKFDDVIPHDAPIAGIRYNVIRRPLGGGKGSIRQKKKQTLEEFYEELEGIIKTATGPEWGMEAGEHFFFQRWNVPYSKDDLVKFQRECLDPILEQLCDWWEDQEKLALLGVGPFDGDKHWRTPYGMYSPLYGAQGSLNEVEEFLESGSILGLRKVDKLFRELDV